MSDHASSRRYLLAYIGCVALAGCESKETKRNESGTQPVTTDRHGVRQLEKPSEAQVREWIQEKSFIGETVDTVAERCGGYPLSSPSVDEYWRIRLIHLDRGWSTYYVKLKTDKHDRIVRGAWMEVD